MDLIVAHHGVRDAIEIKNALLIFEVHVYHARPAAALQKSGHGALHEIMACASCFLNEIGQRFAYNVFVGSSDKIGKAAIDRAELTIQRKGN